MSERPLPYEQPKIIDSFEQLEVLGDATGVGTAGGTGSGLVPNEV